MSTEMPCSGTPPIFLGEKANEVTVRSGLTKLGLVNMTLLRRSSSSKTGSGILTVDVCKKILVVLLQSSLKNVIIALMQK